MRLKLTLMACISILFYMASFGQNKFSLKITKYDFKPMVTVYADSNEADYGVLYGVQNDIIIMESLKDNQLYAYKVDSLSKISFKKGPGFMKIAAPVFITIASVSLIPILIPHTTMIGPFWEFIFINVPVNIPISSAAGGIAALSTKKREIDLKNETYFFHKEFLNKYAVSQQPDTLVFTLRSLKGINNLALNPKFQPKKARPNAWRFELYAQMAFYNNTFTKEVESILGDVNFKKDEKIGHSFPYYLGFGGLYHINPKWSVSAELHHTSNSFLAGINQSGLNANDLHYWFDYYYSTFSFGAEYAIFGTKNNRKKFSLNAGVSAKTKFTNVETSFSITDTISHTFENNKTSAGWDGIKPGIGASLRLHQPIGKHLGFSLTAYADLYDKVSVSEYGI